MAAFGEEWQKRYRRPWWKKVIDVPLDLLAWVLEASNEGSWVHVEFPPFRGRVNIGRLMLPHSNGVHSWPGTRGRARSAVFGGGLKANLPR